MNNTLTSAVETLAHFIQGAQDKRPISPDDPLLTELYELNASLAEQSSKLSLLIRDLQTRDAGKSPPSLDDGSNRISIHTLGPTISHHLKERGLSQLEEVAALSSQEFYDLTQGLALPTPSRSLILHSLALHGLQQAENKQSVQLLDYYGTLRAAIISSPRPLPEEVRSILLSDLPLIIAHIPSKSLRRSGLTTLGQLLDLGSFGLANITGIGPATVQKVYYVLQKLGVASW